MLFNQINTTNMQSNNLVKFRNFSTKLKNPFALIIFLMCINKSQPLIAKVKNMRFGTIGHALDATSGGLFYEYKFSSYLGVQSGLEFGNDYLIITPKNVELENLASSLKERWLNPMKKNNLESIEPKNATTTIRKDIKRNIQSEWGYYEVNFISIPLAARIYPFAGDFSIFIGLRLDILLFASGLCVNNADTSDIEKLTTHLSKPDPNLIDTQIKFAELKKKIKTNDKKFDGTDLLNLTRWSLISGLDYTFSVGFILGAQYRATITNFVNFDKKNSQPLSLLNQNMQISLGFDFVKLFNL